MNNAFTAESKNLKKQEKKNLARTFSYAVYVRNEIFPKR